MATLPERQLSSAQSNALVVALIYERAGEEQFTTGSRGVNWRTVTVLKRRGLMEATEGGGARLTDAGRGMARSLKGELTG
jgi:hypothetical protein